MPAPLADIVAYCDRLLDIPASRDYPGAHNGLQVENNGEVTRIAAAVDAHLGVLEAATIGDRADLLIAHHGMFWSPPVPLTGASYRKVALAVENNLAVYAAHLPLDRHPRLGNNALFAKALGLRRPKPFFYEFDQWIGCRFEVRLTRDALVRRIESVTGSRPTALWHGPEEIRRVGIVTGGAGGSVPAAAREGIDTFITGEGPQHSYGQAYELGLNVIYAGHYATETFGVRALAAHLARKFRLPWTFIDLPTGL